MLFNFLLANNPTKCDFYDKDKQFVEAKIFFSRHWPNLAAIGFSQNLLLALAGAFKKSVWSPRLAGAIRVVPDWRKEGAGSGSTRKRSRSAIWPEKIYEL